MIIHHPAPEQTNVRISYNSSLRFHAAARMHEIYKSIHVLHACWASLRTKLNIDLLGSIKSYQCTRQSKRKNRGSRVLQAKRLKCLSRHPRWHPPQRRRYAFFFVCFCGWTVSGILQLLRLICPLSSRIVHFWSLDVCRRRMRRSQQARKAPRKWYRSLKKKQ